MLSHDAACGLRAANVGVVAIVIVVMLLLVRNGVFKETTMEQ